MFLQWCRDELALSFILVQRYRFVGQDAASIGHHCANTNVVCHTSGLRKRLGLTLKIKEMETVTWKNSDLSGVRFDFESNDQAFGTLTLLSELSSNANFTTDNDRLQFKRVGFRDNRVQIKRNNELIAEIKNRLLGQTYLQLKNGRTFRLSSNLVGRNLKWLDTNGQPIVEYKMATMNSMRKGSILINNSLTKEEKKILPSAGLVAGRFNTYRLTFGIMMIVFLIYLIAKLIS
jgi:hypothetical protein